MSSRWSKRLSLSVALAVLVTALSVLPTVGQVVRAQGASYIPASELGMSPDKSARENRNAFVSKLNSTTYRDASVVFPPGKYLMDNSDVNPRNGVKDFIELKGFTGELKMEEGASFSFTDGKRRGLMLTNRAGTHTIKAAVVGDLANASCNRNLRVDWVGLNHQ